MRGLLIKEWREHRWILLAMLVVLGLTQAVSLRGADMMGSPMVAFQKVVAVMAPMAPVL